MLASQCHFFDLRWWGVVGVACLCGGLCLWCSAVVVPLWLMMRLLRFCWWGVCCLPGFDSLCVCGLRLVWWGVVSVGIYGEFDPGSGRTLAACLTHASRTVNHLRVGISGERVSNTWATCPWLWDNSGKPGLIPDMTPFRMVWGGKGFRLGMGPRPISLLVG